MYYTVMWFTLCLISVFCYVRSSMKVSQVLQHKMENKIKWGWGEWGMFGTCHVLLIGLLFVFVTSANIFLKYLMGWW